ncbi:MAG: sigma-54 dependent transcriptional regulator, partial [Mailhella sp.]|nr:sigma-54 dependent transcriptional regulator [Mailhella sp.]
MSHKNSGIIGEDTSLAEVFKILRKVAPTDSTVLVTGESGTGKEVLVRTLHKESKRTNAPFIPVNCGAIPKELLESELFGHEKGAFTHAIRTKPGRFELAEGGTIFLDEIGEMDTSLQVKILRVLQEKEIERVGGSGPKKIDVRIVAATNRDLEQEVALGNFREDLYYRLNVIPLHLPPLRERGNDILTLAENFLKVFCEKKEREQLTLSEDVAKVFLNYAWPGNVRELENFTERLSILADGPQIVLSDLSPKILNGVGAGSYTHMT